MIKKTLLLISIFCFLNNYSQTQKNSLIRKGNNFYKIRSEQVGDSYYSKEEIISNYISESQEFQSLAKPDTNNELSIFFKTNLNPDVLKKYSSFFFKSDYKNSNISDKIFDYTVRLTFNLNKKNEPYNFSIHTGNREFNELIIKIFKNYPVEKLTPNDSLKTGRYSIQVFAKENKKILIKASTFAVVDKDPTVKDCENNEPQEKLNCRLGDNLFEYILANVSLSTLSKQDLRGEISFYQRFSVDANGKIFRVNSTAPNIIIKNEIDRIIKSYDQTIVPATRNNIAKNTSYYSYHKLIIENIK